MDLKTLKELLASLNINPDEIEDERYATAFRILFASIEKQNEEIEYFKAENQKLRDEINLLRACLKIELDLTIRIGLIHLNQKIVALNR